MSTSSYAISGATGLIGSRLVEELRAANHRVLRLVRRDSPSQRPDDVKWSPGTGLADPSSLDGVDALIHLAGENIADGRWTQAKKDRIVSSRVAATTRLIEDLAHLERPPRTLLCASAVGYYGSNRDQPASEDALPGRDFLAQTCVAWEKAAATAARLGCRVVHLRFGGVLSPFGGALAKMLPLFRLGVGGRLGSGQQMFSWVSLDDAVRACIELLGRNELQGAFNVCSPSPVSNREFTSALGRCLGRPTLLPVPQSALKLVFGEMAEGTLLASNHAIPTALTAAGFEFRHPELRSCLEVILKQS